MFRGQICSVTTATVNTATASFDNILRHDGHVSAKKKTVWVVVSSSRLQGVLLFRRSIVKTTSKQERNHCRSDIAQCLCFRPVNVVALQRLTMRGSYRIPSNHTWLRYLLPNTVDVSVLMQRSTSPNTTSREQWCFCLSLIFFFCMPTGPCILDDVTAERTIQSVPVGSSVFCLRKLRAGI